MSEIDFTGVAAVIIALGSLVAGVASSIVLVMAAHQKKVLEKQGAVIAQVEKQGNASSLELKRTTAAALRTVATVSPNQANELKAMDAEVLYDEAKKQAEQNAKSLQQTEKEKE